MKKILPIPNNWQDFEDLCKELWRVEWPCRDIQFHGRLGQAQQGVDIYGVPKGENKYFGIQCKHKHSGDQLTEKEVDHEIEEAKKFPTPLEILYLATTSENDTNIQNYIITKDAENRKNGLFGVRIYCWPEIADLIRRHKNVLDWYLEEKFHQHSMELIVNLFNIHDGEVILKPKFHKVVSVVRYVQPVEIHDSLKELSNSVRTLFSRLNIPKEDKPAFAIPVPPSLIYKAKLNKSLVKLEIEISNTGEDHLENFFLFLYISDLDFANGIHFQSDEILIEDDEQDKKLREVQYDGENEIINGGMCRRFITYINLPKDKVFLTIKYDFFSKNYPTNGEISIISEPNFIEVCKEKITHNEDEESTKEDIIQIIEEEDRTPISLL